MRNPVRLIAPLFLSILFLLPQHSRAQEPNTTEVGTPLIQSFNPEEYQASVQNWDILQDSLGLVYIANGRGLLIYNGEDFDLLSMPEGHSVRSMAIDRNNRIYCGGAGYFGYLEYKNSGEISFVNLADSISDRDLTVFSNVEDIYCTPKGIYFRSPERLFLWKEHEFEFWDSEDHRFLSSFWVQDQLFINRKSLGIQMLSAEGNFRPFGKDSLLWEKAVTTILPYGDDLLIGTSDQLFLWREDKLVDFTCPAGDLISTSRLFKARQLNNGEYALSTLNDGMLIMDQWGQILLHVNSENGLPSSTIYQVFQTKDDQMWIATSNGFAQMEYPSPFSKFTIGNKTPPISALARYKNNLIVGTSNGLFRLNKSAFPPAYLEPYLGMSDRIWDLLVVGDELLIAFEDGIYISSNQEAARQIETDATSVFYRSKIDSNRIFVGGRKGFYALYFSDGNWNKESIDLPVKEGVYHIHEQEDGTLWLDLNRSWIYRISFSSRKNAANLFHGVLTKLDSTNGLPNVKGYVMMDLDQIYYVDNVNLIMLHYNPLDELFKPDHGYESSIRGASKNMVFANDDKHENKWIVEFEEGAMKNTFLIGPALNTEKPIKLLESRIYDLVGRCIYYQDGILWHGGQNALIRNDLKKSSLLPSFNTIITEVYYQEDSLVSAGPYSKSDYHFPFAKNSFRFTYANTAHVSNEKELYQYHLDGLMDGWSGWSSERKRDFTNLREGKYTFGVRAKSMDGRIGRAASFDFEIIVPWHRSWWAYMIFVLGGFFGARAFHRWRSRRLRREKLALQEMVQLRTAELEVRNEELDLQRIRLSEQAATLREMDRFKSDLFANISHEFRTPLTLIKGPLDQLKKFPESQLTPAHLGMMDRNANRLLRLVNQILDLSKIDAKNLPLNLSEGNVLKSIRVAASTFSSHAADRNVDYQIDIPAGQLWAAFDRDKLEKIIYNLLSNAFKFTSDAGTIKFYVAHINDTLHLEISDTGVGISGTNLHKVFDRFYQVDTSDSHPGEGSGVGLALVKELVHLMHGTIHVDSVLGKGSTFFVEIPLEPIVRLQDVETLERTGLVLKSAEANSSASKKVSNQLPTILLVEDNPDMRTFIREHLIFGYKILEASNGPMGLKIAFDRMPDLIITDLMMPKMDGLELCETIKSDVRTSHMPVIILTAKAGLDNKLEGLETGADVYLTKPFHPEELLIQAKRLIQDRVRLRASFSQIQNLDPKDLNLAKLDQQFIEKVLVILEEKFSDADFDVPHLHLLLAMSRTQLHRKMKALTGMAPGHFIRQFRLKRATQILLQGETVAQTAYSVGFNNLSYFARTFRALHGVSPKEYAQQYRSN